MIQRIQYGSGRLLQMAIARVEPDTRERIAREFQHACNAGMRRMERLRQHHGRYGDPSYRLHRSGRGRALAGGTARPTC